MNEFIFSSDQTAVTGTISRAGTNVEVSGDQLRTSSRPKCLMCDSSGRMLYEGLRDRPFDTPGAWNIRQCINDACGLLWLDPMPVSADIWKAYRTYYTHS